MDGQTTTSFIPKTRITAGPADAGRGFGLSISLGILISGFILFVSLSLFGGAYFYKNSLQKENDEAIASLERAKEAFEPGLIAELSRLSGAIDSAKTVLGRHIAYSKVFDLIGENTLPDVSFSSFSYYVKNQIVSVKMTGEARSYAEVALQAKIFEESDAIEEVSLANLSLKEAGKLGFNTELMIKQEFLFYKP